MGMAAPFDLPGEGDNAVAYLDLHPRRIDQQFVAEHLLDRQRISSSERVSGPEQVAAADDADQPARAGYQGNASPRWPSSAWAPRSRWPAASQ